MKILYKIVKGILLAGCAAIIIGMLLVLWIARDPSAMAELSWTEEAVELYESDPDYFRVTAFKGFEDRNYSKDSLFGYSRTVRIDDLDQWQVLIRYNDSVLEEFENERGNVPYAEGERFIFTLEDDLGHVYTEYSYVWEKTSRHTFIRLIFDGVEESFKSDITAEDGSIKTEVDRISELKLNVYCREDIVNGEYPESPESFMYIWGDGTGIYEYKDLKKELPKNMQPTEGLCSSAALIASEKTSD